MFFLLQFGSPAVGDGVPLLADSRVSYLKGKGQISDTILTPAWQIHVCISATNVSGATLDSTYNRTAKISRKRNNIRY